tara:strand:- start:88337 stop:89896 length:1560 start_codon:yes stop_codon:yes gene_type:complete
MDPTFFMDHPSDRKIHIHPTPRFGGIAFSLVIIIIGWVLLNENGNYNWYFMGAFSLFILGALDDYFTLSWHYKLPIQLFVGFFILLQFYSQIDAVIFFGYFLPVNKYILFIIYLFWFIGITNAINLIDGMDGLAGGFMFIVTLAGGLMGYVHGAPYFAYINVIVGSSLLAFLHFNQKPARFFMGDAGSLFLGYHLAVMPLLFYVASGNSIISNKINITPFILLASYLIADTTRVFVSRIKRGKHPLEPDQLHLHYQLYHYGKSENGTLMAIFLLAGIGCLFAILPSSFIGNNIILLVIYLISLSAFAFIEFIPRYFIILLMKLINKFKTTNTDPWPYKKLFRIRYLPLAMGTYFFCLTYIHRGQFLTLTMLQGTILFTTLLTLFILKDTLTSEHRKFEAILISIGILQAIVLSMGFDAGIKPIYDNSGLPLFISVMRYGALAFSGVIISTNYIVHTDLLGHGFWSITDLLILFSLIGLSALQPLNVGLPSTFTLEIGLVYFTNKLYLPHLAAFFSKESI